jgi:hypothetical protein
MADTDNVIFAAHLFQREKPPAEDSKWWEWGKEFVTGDDMNNLLQIVDEMQEVTTEEQLKGLVTELKSEVEKIPDF